MLMDKLQNFVVWLDGYLEATGDEINVSKTNVIKNKLNSLFEHEADKLSEVKTEQIIIEPDKTEPWDLKPNIGLNRDENGVLYRC
jgi:hypothetical protein